MKKVGVLALQGAFIEHEKMLSKLGYKAVELRSKEDITSLDGLILPGGESTVQGKLLRELKMLDPLKQLIEGGLPVLGTCAGLILLAKNLSNDPNTYFGTLPVVVKRNAYGRQLGSFRCTAPFGKKDLKDPVKELLNVKMTFIRAPFIEKVSDNTEVMAVVDNNIVGVRYKNQVGVSFHPELDDDPWLHEYVFG